MVATGGRFVFSGAIIAAAVLLGTFVVNAGTDDQPYATVFQDLEVTEQSDENTVRLVGGGFAPNSDVAVVVFENATGDIVREEGQVSDAVGRTELELVFDPPLAPGNYSATITGVTPSNAPLQLSGALTIADAPGSPASTEAGSATTPGTTVPGSEDSSSDDSSLVPWIVGGVVLLLVLIALAVAIGRRRSRQPN